MSASEPTVITCARCAARGRIDPLKISTTTTAPCTCGCDGFLMLCQVCGEPIGWGITGGTLDLADAAGDVTGDLYRELFREDTSP